MGKIRSNKRAANAAYLQTTAANQAIKTQLIANIATVYYQLLSVDAQIKVAEETLIVIKVLKLFGIEKSRICY
jgi:outer membrane protein TolC